MKDTDETMRDALYADWSEDRRSATPKPLRDWLNSHADCAQDLLNWAAAAPIADYADQSPPDAVGEARALYIGRQVSDRMRARLEAPLASLLAVATKEGLDAETLAVRLNVSEPLVYKLERRLVRAATIPAELVKRLATTLRLGVQQVQTYLAQPPMRVAGLSYRSETAPQTTQQDFNEAVSACYELTAEQKSFWLAAVQDETR